MQAKGDFSNSETILSMSQPTTSTTSDHGIVLNSWKEIANYLGRGVRTAQRWERDLKMPVRRPRAKSRSAVIAMSAELDAWLRSAPTTELLLQPQGNGALSNSNSELERHAELFRQFRELRSAHANALAELVNRVRALEEQVKRRGFNRVA